MNVSAQMLEARPDTRGVDHAVLGLAIDALSDVVIATTACADSCLHMDTGGDRADCISACNDTADVAGATIRVLSRTGPTVEGTRALVDAAAKMVSECAEVCNAHGDDDKCCRICAETCARAGQALAGLQTAIASAEVAA